MNEQYDIYWEGHSGLNYGYWIIPWNSDIQLISEPGNFIIAKKIKSGIWEPLYIGHTKSLSLQLNDQDILDCLKSHHGTHVHVHISIHNQNIRQQEVNDLIKLWNPICVRISDLNSP